MISIQLPSNFNGIPEKDREILESIISGEFEGDKTKTLNKLFSINQLKELNDFASNGVEVISPKVNELKKGIADLQSEIAKDKNTITELFSVIDEEISELEFELESLKDDFKNSIEEKVQSLRKEHQQKISQRKSEIAQLPEFAEKLNEFEKGLNEKGIKSKEKARLISKRKEEIDKEVNSKTWIELRPDESKLFSRIREIEESEINPETGKTYSSEINDLKSRISELKIKKSDQEDEFWKSKNHDDRKWDLDSLQSEYSFFGQAFNEYSLLLDATKSAIKEYEYEINRLAEKEQIDKALLNQKRKELSASGDELLQGLEFQSIHWTQLASPYKKGLENGMVLLPEGIKKCKFRVKEILKGGTRYVEKNLEITYDKDYVIHWLATKFTTPLKDLPLDVLLSFVEDAYKLSHNLSDNCHSQPCDSSDE